MENAHRVGTAQHGIHLVFLWQTRKIEWLTAMGLVWRYADVSGNPRWKGLTWGMLPFHSSVLCACTYHVFYNAPPVLLLRLPPAVRERPARGRASCWDLTPGARAGRRPGGNAEPLDSGR